MFSIREFEPDVDKEAVVALLKKTFQDSDFFTTPFFEWKHLQNPFGPSPGLVAVDGNGTVIGVRLFMVWNFRVGDKIIKALRPVDTATDEAWQGKGIFKALTLEALKRWEDQYDLVFNTPNKNSLPGYLKMGWKIPDQPLDYYVGMISRFGISTSYSVVDAVSYNAFDTLPYSNATLKSPEFINWRYQGTRYKIFQADINGVLNWLVCRFQKKWLSKMAIVVDFIGDEESLENMIRDVCRKEHCRFVYFGDFGVTRRLKNSFTMKRGNSVVASRSPMIDISTLNFSLGDLEGIL